MRHVLMVAFHYPPIAASAGALRTRAFVRYLAEHGWHAHVLVPKQSAYPETETVTDEDIGDIRRCWAFDARRHLGWQGRYPALAAVPDRWISWAPSAIATGRRLLREFPIEAIWSTYPIATSHLIADVLAATSKRPWVAEFRDPVCANGGRIQRMAQQAIEARAMRAATRNVFVTPGARRHALKRFPEAASRSYVLANGYDEALEVDRGAPPPLKGRPVVLLHSGHLYPVGRNPRSLLEAIARLKSAGRIDRRRLRVVFRNTQQDDQVRPEIEQLGVGDIVQLAARVPHAEALAEQRQADGLLLLQGRAFNAQVPAKVFEYLRAGRPTLALVSPGGDTAGLLTELGAGIQADPDDVDAVERALLDFVSGLERQSGGEPIWQPDAERLSQYSRRRQTAELAALFDAVAGVKTVDS
ncbi:glycosyltransferase [Salinisphaera hydrothermalis]|uniref:Glycosyltransferase subfamily 4-like N-terminal domain-containing protein n=1 Tax=Salinisphaera hydrothermalis (strain C41B8) TaxID=1304275 RepID=A0A084IMD5_SALHC|nr:glycosyltransferase [Salinisphaera hydrothermalis]KEZ77869.1 hypothetical protein C41B8_07477 [Salinisphaera hydrothermalis C41B8]